MADNKRLRSQRSNDPYRRGGHPAGEQPSGDPLAELARLIGQSDPFADYGRKDARDRDQRDAQPKAPPASDWRKDAAAMPPYDSRPEEALRAPPAARREPRFADPPSPRHDAYQAAAEEPLDRRYPERPGHYRREPQFADEPFPSREDERMYAAPARDQRPPRPAYFDEGAPMGPEDEDAYDDPPRAPRRSRLMTAMTLIGCAMIGTAGAYGYRTYYVSPSARTPPVITAESSPSKLVSAAEGQPGKFIQDRVRDSVQNERMISREEQPVEIRTPSSAPRAVSPSPAAPSQSQSVFPPPPPVTPPTGSGAAVQPSASGTGEPKRVRTVTIRPDGIDAPSRPAATPPAPKASPPRTTGPISLDPQDSQAAPAPRDRIAAAPATTQSLPPPAPRASEVATGGYAVQISSQRSEAEAQASYRALQAKFPDQLSDRSAMIRRVDLGAKGIYYRALVGPFASSDEAAQFCTDFKAAGGQCFIQRN